MEKLQNIRTTYTVNVSLKTYPDLLLLLFFDVEFASLILANIGVLLNLNKWSKFAYLRIKSADLCLQSINTDTLLHVYICVYTYTHALTNCNSNASDPQPQLQTDLCMPKTFSAITRKSTLLIQDNWIVRMRIGASYCEWRAKETKIKQKNNIKL